jgi:hypothetical protein
VIKTPIPVLREYLAVVPEDHGEPRAQEEAPVSTELRRGHGIVVGP